MESEVSPLKQELKNIAEKTNYWLTIGNVIDAFGIFATFQAKKSGLDTKEGFSWGAVSIGFDFIDGKAARWSDTASSLGEKFDKIGDKTKLAVYIPELWKKNLAPKAELLGIGTLQAFNTGVTLTDRAFNGEEGQVLHSTKSGEIAIALEEIGIGAHALASLIKKDKPKSSKVLDTVGSVISYAGIGIGTYASYDYARTLYRAQKSKRA